MLFMLLVAVRKYLNEVLRTSLHRIRMNREIILQCLSFTFDIILPTTFYVFGKNYLCRYVMRKLRRLLCGKDNCDWLNMRENWYISYGQTRESPYNIKPKYQYLNVLRQIHSEYLFCINHGNICFLNICRLYGVLDFTMVHKCNIKSIFYIW